MKERDEQSRVCCLACPCDLCQTRDFSRTLHTLSCHVSVEHERQSDLRRLVASSKLSALERLADDAERTPPRLGGTLALELRRVSHLLRVRVRVRVLGLGLGLGSGLGC